MSNKYFEQKLPKKKSKTGKINVNIKIEDASA